MKKKNGPIKRRFHVNTYCDGEFHSTKEILVKWSVKEAKEKLVNMAMDFGGDDYKIATYMYEAGPGSDEYFSYEINVESKNGKVKKTFVYKVDCYPW